MTSTSTASNVKAACTSREIIFFKNTQIFMIFTEHMHLESHFMALREFPLTLASPCMRVAACVNRARLGTD